MPSIASTAFFLLHNVLTSGLIWASPHQHKRLAGWSNWCKIVGRCSNFEKPCWRCIAVVVQNISTIIAGLLIAFIANWELALIILGLIPMIGLQSFFQVKLLDGFNADAKKMYEEAEFDVVMQLQLSLAVSLDQNSLTKTSYLNGQSGVPSLGQQKRQIRLPTSDRPFEGDELLFLVETKAYLPFASPRSKLPNICTSGTSN
ncbi:ABC transporter B family member 9 [Nymphaea thermarum]|nr:ABC transporter B family member 9 [Nymphaea thermarum]